MRNACDEGPDQSAHSQSEQDVCCLLTESVAIAE